MLAADDRLHLGTGEVYRLRLAVDLVLVLDSGGATVEIDDTQSRGQVGSPTRRQGHLAQNGGRQAAEANGRRQVLLDDVAGDALEGDGFGLRRRCGVELQHRAAFDEYPVVLEEVEVRLDLGDAPELGQARNSAARLQHEARRRRTDVAQLDDLDRAVSVKCETRDGAAV